MFVLHTVVELSSFLLRRYNINGQLEASVPVVAKLSLELCNNTELPVLNAQVSSRIQPDGSDLLSDMRTSGEDRFSVGVDTGKLSYISIHICDIAKFDDASRALRQSGWFQAAAFCDAVAYIIDHPNPEPQGYILRLSGGERRLIPSDALTPILTLSTLAVDYYNNIFRNKTNNHGVIILNFESMAFCGVSIIGGTYIVGNTLNSFLWLVRELLPTFQLMPDCVHNAISAVSSNVVTSTSGVRKPYEKVFPSDTRTVNLSDYTVHDTFRAMGLANEYVRDKRELGHSWYRRSELLGDTYSKYSSKSSIPEKPYQFPEARFESIRIPFLMRFANYDYGTHVDRGLTYRRMFYYPSQYPITTNRVSEYSVVTKFDINGIDLLLTFLNYDFEEVLDPLDHFSVYFRYFYYPLNYGFMCSIKGLSALAAVAGISNVDYRYEDIPLYMRYLDCNLNIKYELINKDLNTHGAEAITSGDDSLLLLPSIAYYRVIKVLLQLSTVLTHDIINMSTAYPCALANLEVFELGNITNCILSQVNHRLGSWLMHRCLNPYCINRSDYVLDLMPAVNDDYFNDWFELSPDDYEDDSLFSVPESTEYVVHPSDDYGANSSDEYESPIRYAVRRLAMEYAETPYDDYHDQSGFIDDDYFDRHSEVDSQTWYCVDDYMQHYDYDDDDDISVEGRAVFHCSTTILKDYVNAVNNFGYCEFFVSLTHHERSQLSRLGIEQPIPVHDVDEFTVKFLLSSILYYRHRFCFDVHTRDLTSKLLTLFLKQHIHVSVTHDQIMKFLFSEYDLDIMPIISDEFYDNIFFNRNNFELHQSAFRFIISMPGLIRTSYDPKLMVQIGDEYFDDEVIQNVAVESPFNCVFHHLRKYRMLYSIGFGFIAGSLFMRQMHNCPRDIVIELSKQADFPFSNSRSELVDVLLKSMRLSFDDLLINS